MKRILFASLSAGRVTTADQLSDLALTGIEMPDNGYLYVYVSNELQKDVNFDNLQIGHSSTHLTEVNDYYPYGLLINNNSSFGSTAQNYKYNGKELQTDLSFNVEDYGARYYDPVIGRWMQVDPKTELGRRWSPYCYGFNNPIRFIDSDGMWPDPAGVGTNPLSYVFVGFGQYFQEFGSVVDAAGGKIKAFISFGGEEKGASGALTGNISNETKTTLTIGTTVKDFFTPTRDNKSVVSSPFDFSVETVNETNVSVSGKITVECLDIQVKNVTSRDNKTGEVNNTSKITIGKDQSGIFVEGGTKGTSVGVQTEHKVSAPNGSFIKFGGSLSVGKRK